MLSVLRVGEIANLEDDPTDSPKVPHELERAGDALAALPATSKLPVAMSPPSNAALVASGWPWGGDVSFENVSMRYNSNAPLVLKDLFVNIPKGTTLGVVGRTGSGKSSLLVSLFRLTEIEGGRDSGEISIDGIDVRSVDLQTLRESLTIIPQDPVLFRGSLYDNLDATEKVSKEDAWKAIETASPELANQLLRKGGLDMEITEGGKNLSVGQRQLLCLARALLRKSKVVVLDEATSSVDSNTDRLVQEIIQKQFVDKGVSVITVAHRLNTVLGYDKIAVLGDGEVLEYGRPDELLKNPRGELRQLVEADSRSRNFQVVKR